MFFPPMVTCAFLGFLAVFAVAVSVTLPFPTPPPGFTDTQLWLLLAVQLTVEGLAVTVTT